MRYQLLGRSGLRVSEICLGALTMAAALLKSQEKRGRNSRRSFQIFPLSFHCLLASRQSLNPNET
jgi:aryl-alcohol dehydrogenase-like predicted oxidoreductase